METLIELNVVKDDGYRRWDFSLINELDALLNWFAQWRNRGMERTFEDIYVDLSKTTFKQYKGYIKDIAGIIRVCLNKLVKDQLVIENKNQLNIDLNTGKETFKTAYSISFEGLLFIETEKSYANHYAEKNQAKNHAEQVEKALLANNKWSKNGTIIAALATSVLVLIEMEDKKYFAFRVDLKSCLVLLFFGIAVGMLLLIAIQEWVRQNTK